MGTPQIISFALIVGIAAGIACLLWGNSNDIDQFEAGDKGHELTSAYLDTTIDDLAAGRQYTAAEKDARRAAFDVAYAEATALDQPDTWPADHPVESGIVAAIVVTVVGRILLFMHRLEARSSDLTGRLA